MNLSSKTDIEAPLGFVFASLADHAAWEREAAQRGVAVERPADMPLSGPGAGWMIRAPFRGKQVSILMRLDQVVPNERLVFSIQSKAIEGGVVLSLIALSPRRTRLHLTMDIKPKSIAARLLLNTLRLAKTRVQKRLDGRVAQMGRQILDGFARSGG